MNGLEVVNSPDNNCALGNYAAISQKDKERWALPEVAYLDIKGMIFSPMVHPAVSCLPVGFDWSWSIRYRQAKLGSVNCRGLNFD